MVSENSKYFSDISFYRDSDSGAFAIQTPETFESVIHPEYFLNMNIPVNSDFVSATIMVRKILMQSFANTMFCDNNVCEEEWADIAKYANFTKEDICVLKKDLDIVNLADSIVNEMKNNKSFTDGLCAVDNLGLLFAEFYTKNPETLAIPFTKEDSRLCILNELQNLYHDKYAIRYLAVYYKTMDFLRELANQESSYSCYKMLESLQKNSKQILTLHFVDSLIIKTTSGYTKIFEPSGIIIPYEYECSEFDPYLRDDGSIPYDYLESVTCGSKLRWRNPNHV